MTSKQLEQNTRFKGLLLHIIVKTNNSQQKFKHEKKKDTHKRTQVSD